MVRARAVMVLVVPQSAVLATPDLGEASCTWLDCGWRATLGPQAAGAGCGPCALLGIRKRREKNLPCHLTVFKYKGILGQSNYGAPWVG